MLMKKTICLFNLLLYVLGKGIKLMTNYVLCPTIQKTLDQFVMDAHVAELMKPEKFAGDNFKRWQSKVRHYLLSKGLWWIIPQVRPLTRQQVMDFELANDTVVAVILSLLENQLYDVYHGYTSAIELWEALDRKYVISDAGRWIYVVEQYHDFRMVDGVSVVKQAHDLTSIVSELAQFDVNVNAKFVVGGIIAKLPPSWRDFATTLKHKREAMRVDDLIAHLDVEEKARAKDTPSMANDGTSDANFVQKSGAKYKGKQQNPKAKNTTNFKKKKEGIICYVCGEPGHKANKCHNRKGKKGGQQNR